MNVPIRKTALSLAVILVLQGCTKDRSHVEFARIDGEEGPTSALGADLLFEASGIRCNEPELTIRFNQVTSDGSERTIDESIPSPTVPWASEYRTLTGGILPLTKGHHRLRVMCRGETVAQGDVLINPCEPGDDLLMWAQAQMYNCVTREYACSYFSQPRRLRTPRLTSVGFNDRVAEALAYQAAAEKMPGDIRKQFQCYNN